MITVLKRGNYWQLKSPDPSLQFLLEMEDSDNAYLIAEIRNNTGIVEFTSARQKEIEFSRKYRLYETCNEKLLTDGLHLEILLKDGCWQGYLLPQGIPDKKLRKKDVIRTSELITKCSCTHC